MFVPIPWMSSRLNLVICGASWLHVYIINVFVKAETEPIMSALQERSSVQPNAMQWNSLCNRDVMIPGLESILGSDI